MEYTWLQPEGQENHSKGLTVKQPSRSSYKNSIHSDTPRFLCATPTGKSNYARAWLQAGGTELRETMSL